MPQLYIKNMVCPRCVETVKQIFINLNIATDKIALGEVHVKQTLNNDELKTLQSSLISHGFDLLSDKESALVNQIKSYVIEKVHYHKHESKLNLSEELSKLLHKEYSLISKTFSTIEGITIEQFVSLQKIERVKELLSYNELTLSQIADEMDFSSTAYLSARFKKVTGITPTAFKQQHNKDRKFIDHIK